MNKTKKNIVLVGFSSTEVRSIKVPPIGKNYYLNDMTQAKKHQGYLIIINNKDKQDIVSFDKKYRKILNKYVHVWLYNEEYNELLYKWSNIETKNRDIFLIDELNFWDSFEEYKNNIENQKENKKYTEKRLTNINKLYEYLKQYKTIKTSKISEYLQMNPRNVERYMHDINQIYHNIGYDYSNNEWYMIW